MKLTDLSFKRGTYLAFVLSDESRNELLKLKRASFDKVICHHITIQSGLTEKKFEEMKEFLPGDLGFYAFGHSMGAHIECFSVKMHNILQEESSIKRWDGGFYHITHSLEAPARAVDSNELLKRLNGAPQEVFKKPIKLTGSFKLL